MPQDTSDPGYKFTFKSSLFGVQVFLVVFGGLVTIPLITGLDPNVALFTAGAATLIFQLFTKRMVPVFLASSFVFLAPTIYGVKAWGIPATMGGLAVAALAFFVLSGLIKWKGSEMLETIFPPIIIGPIIMVIGLILAPVAVSMALGKADPDHLIAPKSALFITMVSLTATAAVAFFAKGTFRYLSIVCGMLIGYLVSIPFGLIDFSVVSQTPWIGLPKFVLPRWNGQAVLFILPAAIAPAIGHLADILAIGEVTGKKYFSDPGFHRTLLGNGVTNLVAVCLGGPPNSASAEVTGTLAFTKLHNPAIMTWAAIIALVFACIGKLGAFLHTIPTPVTGGILIILFGAVLVAGINSLVKIGQDLLELRNLVIVACVLVFGIGGITFTAGSFSFGGVALATVLGIVLNAVLPKKNKSQQ